MTTTKTATKTATGFYASMVEFYFVDGGGRTWIVASPDDIGPDPVAIDELPADAEPLPPHTLTPAEIAAYHEEVVRAGGTI